MTEPLPAISAKPPRPKFERKQDKKRRIALENLEKARVANKEKAEKMKKFEGTLTLEQMQEKTTALTDKVEDLEKKIAYLTRKAEIKKDILELWNEIVFEKKNGTLAIKKEARKEPKIMSKILDSITKLLTESDRGAGADGAPKVEFNILGADTPVKVVGNPMGDIVVDIGKKVETLTKSEDIHGPSKRASL